MIIKPLAKRAMSRYEECHYMSWDADKNPDVRVTHLHPAIGRHLVRASIMMYEEAQAIKCCKWLNEMVAARNGVTDRFKVMNYKDSSRTWIVARRVLPTDRIEAIDEQIEVKSR